jgi:hypothetical protein
MTTHNEDCSHLGPGVTMLGLFEVDRNTYPPGSAEEVAEKQKLVAPEVELRKATLSKCEQDLAQSGESLAEVDRAAALIIGTCSALTLRSYQERITTGTACNAAELAQSINALQIEVNFHTGTADLLRYRIIPGQNLHKLKADLALREVVYLDATLKARALEIETLTRLNGVYEVQGRLAIIGGHSELLEQAAAECKRQVALAREELRAEILRQRTVEQQRKSCGLVTKAEILAPAACDE